MQALPRLLRAAPVPLRRPPSRLVHQLVPRSHPSLRISSYTGSSLLPQTFLRVGRSPIRHLSVSDNPPANQSALSPTQGRELVLSPPALVITREYEWANIIVGFEQANRYTIRAAPGGQVVGYLAEESSLGSVVTRNVMRTRRPFKATVFDKDGEIIFTLRRPLFLISSSINVESPDGTLLGEVIMNWHVWRRRYDLFIDKTQFASVNSGFLAVDFDMRDVNGQKLASVNKDFTGFAREIFTDARQYVLRLDPSFGLSSDGVLVNDAATVDVPSENYSDAKMGPRERAVVLATAIAIDFDYFSLHSRSGMNPGLMMMPGMGGGPAPADGGAGAGAGAGAAVGADILSDAAAGTDDPAAGTDEPISNDPYGTPLSSDDASEGQGDMEWGTFEEPDHGFAEDPSSSDSDEWSGFGTDGASDTGSEGGGGLMDVLSDIFSGGSD